MKTQIRGPCDCDFGGVLLHDDLWKILMKTQIRDPCDPKYDIAGDLHVLLDDSAPCQIVNIDDRF